MSFYLVQPTKQAVCIRQAVNIVKASKAAAREFPDGVREVVHLSALDLVRLHADGTPLPVEARRIVQATTSAQRIVKRAKDAQQARRAARAAAREEAREAEKEAQREATKVAREAAAAARKLEKRRAAKAAKAQAAAAAPVVVAPPAEDDTAPWD